MIKIIILILFCLTISYGACIEGQDGCSKCSGDLCGQCNANQYYFLNKEGTCVLLSKGCIQAQYEQKVLQCIKCQDNYLLSSGPNKQCYIKINDCLTYSKQGLCIQCSAQKQPDDSGQQCVAADTNMENEDNYDNDDLNDSIRNIRYARGRSRGSRGRKPAPSRPSTPRRPGTNKPKPKPSTPSRPGTNKPKPKPSTPSRPGTNKPKPSTPSRPGTNKPKPKPKPSTPSRPGTNKPKPNTPSRPGSGSSGTQGGSSGTQGGSSGTQGGSSGSQEGTSGSQGGTSTTNPSGNNPTGSGTISQGGSNNGSGESTSNSTGGNNSSNTGSTVKTDSTTILNCSQLNKQYTGLCQSCVSGYSLSSTQKACVKSTDNCKIYSDSSCSVCNSGFTKKNGSCEKESSKTSSSYIITFSFTIILQILIALF